MMPFPIASWRSVPSGAFSPTDISGMVAWYAADTGVYSDAGVTPSTNGGTVQQWNDKSSNGRNLTQATLSQKPVLTTGALNSKPVITFDGVNDFMAYTTAFTAINGRTIYIVAGFTSTATTATNRYIFDGYTSTNRSATGLASDLQLLMFAGTNLFSATFSGNAAYLVRNSIFNSTSSQHYLNNAQVGTTGDAGSNTLIDLVVGSGRTGTNFWSDAKIAEIIVYSGVHNSTQLGQVNGYLNGRYAIY